MEDFTFDYQIIKKEKTNIIVKKKLMLITTDQNIKFGN